MGRCWEDVSAVGAMFGRRSADGQMLNEGSAAGQLLAVLILSSMVPFQDDTSLVVTQLAVGGPEAISE